MRDFIVIGIPRSETEKSVLLAGPEVPLIKQRELVKEFKVKPVSAQFARVEHWSGGSGLQFRVRCMTPQAHKAQEDERKARAEAAKAKEAEAAKASEEKPKQEPPKTEAPKPKK